MKRLSEFPVAPLRAHDEASAGGTASIVLAASDGVPFRVIEGIAYSMDVDPDAEGTLTIHDGSDFVFDEDVFVKGPRHIPFKGMGSLVLDGSADITIELAAGTNAVPNLNVLYK